MLFDENFCPNVPVDHCINYSTAGEGVTYTYADMSGDSGFIPQQSYVETVPLPYNRAALQERNEYNVPIHSNLASQHSYVTNDPIDENSHYPVSLTGNWTAQADNAMGMPSQASLNPAISQSSYYPACEVTYSDPNAPRLLLDSAWTDRQVPNIDSYPSSLQPPTIPQDLSEPISAVNAPYEQYSNMPNMRLGTFAPPHAYPVNMSDAWTSNATMHPLPPT